MVKFLLSILLFIALFLFSVDCCANEPQCEIQNIKDVFQERYDIIYQDIFDIRFPEKFYKREKKSVKDLTDLPTPLWNIYKDIRKKIAKIVGHKDLIVLLAEETFLFKLVFWAIYAGKKASLISGKKVSHLLNEIQYLDDVSELSQDQLTQISGFALKGLDKAFQKGLPLEDFRYIKAQISEFIPLGKN
jgi:hypothetical protein